MNGSVRDEGSVPGLLATPAPQKAARGREHNFLFCHLTLSGPSDETTGLVNELVDSLAKRFFAATGSVTSALRRAVIETNEQLLRHNLSAKSTHEGALSCAVLHNGELYTLQVGEGLAFLGHNFGVERLPAKAPQHLTPLGRSAGIDIRFAFHRLQNGDMMLMCDPRLSRLTGDSLASVLVDTEIETGVESLLEVMAGDSARLLLVEFADELPSTLPITFQHSKKPAAKVTGAKTIPVVGQPIGKVAPTKPSSLPVRASYEHATIQPVALTIDTPVLDSTAPLATSARRVASSSARGLSRFTSWLADILGLLGRKESYEPAIHWSIPTTVALIIPLVVGAVVTSVYLQRDTVAEVSVIKQQMMDELFAAENAGDSPSESQTHYLAVLALAADAEALRPNDLEVARMRSDALNALDRIDGVSRLTAGNFYRYSAGANLTRITLRGPEGGIAVLDQLANRVMFHATDDTYRTLTASEPTTIGFGGQSVGANTMNTLLDILWIPGSASTTRDNIAMLDSSGGFFSYYPNLGDTSGIILGNSGAWVVPQAMATYLDRLYVLDSGAGQIWKYYGSSGYTQFEGDEAIFFSANAGLDQAVDFDLFAEDGSLIVLYKDGRIRYYDTRSGRIQWDETTLAEGGLATPFVAPVSVKLVGSGLNASIFVLDPGTGRLVQLSRGGTVLSQYRIMDSAGTELLTKAMDFAITSSPLQIFVVSGSSIYVASSN